MLSVLSSVLKAAVEWKALNHNPAHGLPLPGKNEKYGKAIPPPAQLQSLLACLDADTGLFVKVLALTGLRISEAIALKWSDIDWQAQTVRVERRWYRAPPRLALLSGPSNVFAMIVQHTLNVRADEAISTRRRPQHRSGHAGLAP